MPNQRLDPEQLLQRAQKEERQKTRGKLKIYLGAAPGVGKTYEMLHDALDKRAKGLDVVVGIAESHGREEINQLLKNFEILPRQTVSYRDKPCLEFDLDAALQRHPGLILVDEMAHTNIPGLRHTKRWQDIKELLERGIDVYTTLNVQHIESLKDNIAKIIQAPIIETVPDSMLEMANTIELVDLPYEELLKRLQEGKVYIPQQAELAREHFFRKGNLIALRELALRATAERVGTDVLWYRQDEGIKQIWPIKDKILVCVGPKPEALKLIRAAKRIANSLQAEWIAIYIDTPQLQSRVRERNKAIQNLRLAELLGAETHVLTGFDRVKEILNFAREQNATQIMISKHVKRRLRDFFDRNLADEIVRYSSDIDVYIINTEVTKTPYVEKEEPPSIPWNVYAITLGIVILTTLINGLLYPYFSISNLVMIYLLGVTIVALFGQVGPSILASVLSVAAYDYFFIPPSYSFAITDIQYVLTLLVMLLVSQIISHLTILIRRQTESNHATQHQMTALYMFTRKLTHIRGTEKIVILGVRYISSVFNCDVMVLLPKLDRLEIQSIHKSKQHLDIKEQSIAQWVYEMGQPAGFGTDTLSFSNALYLPLLGTSGPIGVLRIQSRSQQLLTPEQRDLLESCISQTALALEVERLNEKTRQKELEVEADRARTSLLESIFYDLCFPLKLVINTLSQIKANDGELVEKIGENIDYEIEKLNRLNNNLFLIIQLESQNIKLQKSFFSMKHIINTAIEISSKTFEKRPMKVDIPADLPEVMLDEKLIYEVLIHLLDNAIKFSPSQTPIHILVHLEFKKIVVSVEDLGIGILPHEKNKLFKKFYRGNQIIEVHGLGLGLAICQKIIEAHKGTIWVENIKNKGAAFRFSLPL